MMAVANSCAAVVVRAYFFGVQGDGCAVHRANGVSREWQHGVQLSSLRGVLRLEKIGFCS